MVVAIVVQEGLQEIEFRPQPFRVAPVRLDKEGGMLSQARLAHIFLVDVLWFRKPVATGEDRNPAVHAAEFEKIEHAAAFVRPGSIQFRAVA